MLPAPITTYGINLAIASSDRSPSKPLKQAAAPRRWLHRLLLPVVMYNGLARRYLISQRFADASAA